MISTDGEYFGLEPQQALQRRADMLWRLLHDDPGYSCHGRVVALAGFAEDDADRQIALARLQGVGPAPGVPGSAVGARREILRAAGLQTDEYVSWRTADDALSDARSVVANRALSDDLEVATVDEATPAEELRKLSALTQSCGVLLPMGSFMRGLRRPAVCMYARDRSGKIVGATAAVAQHHPRHAMAPEVWWGMLATDESRRGEGIALIMGALSMLAMNERFGYTAFFTGVRQGNAASEALCAKLGLVATDAIDLMAIDPDAFSAGRMTK